MSRETHRVGRLAVEVAVPDLDKAMALRPRVEAMCRDLVPTVLERVCTAMAPADLDIRIARVDLDLGVMRHDHLEEDTIAALEAAFSEQLSRAILSARRNATADARSLTLPEARLQRFDSYLVSGTLPLLNHGEPFDPLARLLELAVEQPDALVAMLRRRAHDPYALERLVFQLGERGLPRLLALLVPADATVIVGLLEDFFTVRRSEHPPELDRIGEPALRRRIWVISLEFLLRDMGSQFNRRRFLRFLLEREARRAGIGYAAVLRLLAAAAGLAAQRQPLRSSLPRTLAELLDEFQEAEAPAAFRSGLSERISMNADSAEERGRAERRTRIEIFLAGGHPRRSGALLAGMAALDPVWLAERIRQRAREAPDELPALARRLLDWLLPREVLGLLLPGQGEPLARMVERAPGREAEAAVPLIVAVLRGEAPDHAPDLALDHAPGGQGDEAYGRELDRDALLGYWLEHGTVAAWAPPGMTGAELLADLPERSVARLTGLVLAADAGGSLLRLSRAVRALDSGRAERLTRRLMPWIASRASPLAGLLAGLDGAARLRALSEAADARAPEPPRAGSRPLPDIVRDLAAMAARSSGAAPAFTDSGPANPAPTDRAVDPARLFAWLDGGGSRYGDEADLVRQFALLADRGDPALRAYLAANRTRPAARARWAAILPQEAMGRLVALLVPAGSRELVDSVVLIGAAWRYTAPFGAPRPEPRFLWSSLLERIAEPRPIDLASVLARVLEGLMESLTQGEEAQRAKLTARARHLAREGGYVTIGAALRRTSPSRADQRSPRPHPARPEPAAPPPRRTAGDRHPGGPPTSRADRMEKGRPGGEPDHPVYIGNAGLVLFNPYLPMLFERLGLLPGTAEPRERRTGIADLSRAAHLLQYLVDGRLDAPEPELVLNKLLCGQPSACPVARSLMPPQADLDLCDGLIQAVIDQWPPLRNTSPAGLRETFLQREGRLRHSDGKWHLQVQRKTLDVLIDQIPWGFSVIFHKWMTDPIHVTW